MATKNDKLKQLLEKLSKGEVNVTRITPEHIALNAKYVAMEKQYSDDYNNEIKRLNQTITEQSATISEQNTTIIEQEEQLADALSQSTEWKNRSVSLWDQVKSLKEENRQQAKKIKEKDKTIEQDSIALKGQSGTIESKQHEINVKEDTIRQQKTDIANLKKQLPSERHESPLSVLIFCTIVPVIIIVAFLALDIVWLFVDAAWTESRVFTIVMYTFSVLTVISFGLLVIHRNEGGAVLKARIFGAVSIILLSALTIAVNYILLKNYDNAFILISVVTIVVIIVMAFIVYNSMHYVE